MRALRSRRSSRCMEAWGFARSGVGPRRPFDRRDIAMVELRAEEPTPGRYLFVKNRRLRTAHKFVSLAPVSSFQKRERFGEGLVSK